MEFPDAGIPATDMPVIVNRPQRKNNRTNIINRRENATNRTFWNYGKQQ